MHAISRGQSLVGKNNLFRANYNILVHRQYLVDETEQGVEGGLNGIAAINRDIAVQNLLKDLGVGDQTLTLGDQLFQPSLGIAAMRVGRADQVHRDVGIDEDHDRKPLP